ncbi:hypothetical protein BDI4_300073 [Burkholderia diffusa]|nr:hypothetical protein BDI4_300073 [Burkholderia diffusa]
MRRQCWRNSTRSKARWVSSSSATSDSNAVRWSDGSRRPGSSMRTWNGRRSSRRWRLCCRTARTKDAQAERKAGMTPAGERRHPSSLIRFHAPSSSLKSRQLARRDSEPPAYARRMQLPPKVDTIASIRAALARCRRSRST